MSVPCSWCGDRIKEGDPRVRDARVDIVDHEFCHALRMTQERDDARAERNRLWAALVWARNYAIGFDHLRECKWQPFNEHPCTCGYDLQREPLDVTLAASKKP